MKKTEWAQVVLLHRALETLERVKWALDAVQKIGDGLQRELLVLNENLAALRKEGK